MLQIPELPNVMPPNVKNANNTGVYVTPERYPINLFEPSNP
jgi:hypothetical protein